jgi:hypothetical protein
VLVIDAENRPVSGCLADTGGFGIGSRALRRRQAAAPNLMLYLFRFTAEHIYGCIMSNDTGSFRRSANALHPAQASEMKGP